MAFMMMRLNFVHPDPTDAEHMSDRYRAGIDLAEYADKNGFAMVSTEEHTAKSLVLADLVVFAQHGSHPSKRMSCERMQEFGRVLQQRRPCIGRVDCSNCELTSSEIAANCKGRSSPTLQLFDITSTLYKRTRRGRELSSCTQSQFEAR